MDLTCTPTPTKTPDSEIDTPPFINPLSFTTNNRTFKNHRRQPPCTAAVTYKECLKNHAASIGGHALDGCGEFIASPDSSPSDPISLKCAACGCHRNFHLREPSGNHPTTHYINFHHPVLRRYSASPSPPSSPSPPPLPPTENPSRRKRFRTKFTQEQKEKMYMFSERLGWKLQKRDEAIVDEFCNEVGIGKGVLRVWMHNNKNTFWKKEYQISNNNRDDSFEEKNGFNINGTKTTSTSNEDHHQHESSNNDNSTSNRSGLHLHISTNGSSSSS
ncbi:unnamed protein product [Withania somnifera]